MPEEFLNKRSAKAIKRSNSILDAAEKVRKAHEDSLALKEMNYKPEIETLAPTAKFKQHKRQQFNQKRNKLAASIFAEDLAKSLGTVVARATNLNSGDDSVAIQVAKKSGQFFHGIITSGKVNFDSVNYEETPHTKFYIDALHDAASHKAAVQLEEETEDLKRLAEDEKVISTFEENLSSAVNVKMQLMMQDEKRLTDKIREDERLASESMYPDKFMEKKAKEHTSYFRKIMDLHSQAALKDNATGMVDQERVLSESLVSYNILETLHTSRLATDADLSWQK